MAGGIHGQGQRQIQFPTDGFQAPVDVMSRVDVLHPFFNFRVWLDNGKQISGTFRIVLVHNLLHTFLPLDEELLSRLASATNPVL